MPFKFDPERPDITPDAERMREIAEPISEAWSAGTLTKEQFRAAWREYEEVVGDIALRRRQPCDVRGGGVAA